MGSFTGIPPRRAIWTLRVTWVTWAVFELGMAWTAVSSTPPGVTSGIPLTPRICILVFLIAVPIAWATRCFLFRRRRVNGLLPVEVYAFGSNVLWLACGTTAIYALAVAMANGTLWPTALVVIGSFCIQVLTFPRLSAMEARANPFAQQP